MAKWTLSLIVGTIILLSIAGVRLYSSDYRFLLTSMPEQDVFILEYDSGDKVEIVTKSSVCDYALFRITKDEFTAKCGWRKLLDAKWYLEYYKTYGTDEWVRLQRKPSLISLEVSKIPDGFIVKKTTPYYATKSRSGTAGNLIETFHITQDRVKSFLEFDTEYTNRKWRVMWKTTPNVEVLQDNPKSLVLDKNLNIFFDDKLFTSRADNYAYYKEQKGSFKIDPLIIFGNLSATSTMGSFRYGFCDPECDNLGNVSFESDSSAFSSTYHSGWIWSDDLRTPDNMTFLCEDNLGAGYCELNLRNGTEIIPANDSATIVRCLFNKSISCFGDTTGTGSGYTYLPGGIHDFDGVYVEGTDTFYLGINTSDPSQERGSNYTINVSEGYLDMMVTFK